MTFEEYLHAEKWRLGDTYISDRELIRFLKLTFEVGYALGKKDALDMTTTEGNNEHGFAENYD